MPEAVANSAPNGSRMRAATASRSRSSTAPDESASNLRNRLDTVEATLLGRAHRCLCEWPSAGTTLCCTWRRLSRHARSAEQRACFSMVNSLQHIRRAVRGTAWMALARSCRKFAGLSKASTCTRRSTHVRTVRLLSEPSASLAALLAANGLARLCLLVFPHRFLRLYLA